MLHTLLKNRKLGLKTREESSRDQQKQRPLVSRVPPVITTGIAKGIISCLVMETSELTSDPMGIVTSNPTPLYEEKEIMAMKKSIQINVCVVPSSLSLAHRDGFPVSLAYRFLTLTGG